MDLSLRLLRAFLVVAEEEHVGRAARRLFVSQPALSQDVRRLERQVGVALFDRGPRGMTLTPAGAAFADAARGALLALDRAADDARRAGGAGNRPRVSLAYTPSLGNDLLPRLLPELERRRPHIEISEREVDTGEAAPAVEAGRSDLALAHCPDPSPRLRATPLADEPLVAAVAADHPLARRDGPAALDELAGLDLLLWPRRTAPAYHDRILEICRAAGLTVTVRPGPRRALTRSYLLAGRDVFALLPRGAAALPVPGLALLPLRDPDAVVPLVLLGRHDEDRPETAEIADALRETVAALLDAGGPTP
ncbi:LysR family transcriptional regulator [Thermomonospora umbrina]|uniref:LysR family transcriptional regulator n=1 Tax=Thermomonospora umbrina TaxID=111806 RepID=A0A3D9T9J3_9ACTN|nr:LysR family transcriptional regulator [Thermomonospora umbrina]REF00432.1 LysR family transcriptional regulator [Thermomonospora umbrina]